MPGSLPDPKSGAMIWGETGPRLTAEAVRKYAMNGMRSLTTFCPLAYLDWHKAL